MPRWSSTTLRRPGGGGEVVSADEEPGEACEQLVGVIDDVEMCDAEGNETGDSQSQGSGKRKRNASHFTKTIDTTTPELNDTDSGHEMATTGRARQPSQKLREASEMQKEVQQRQGGQGLSQAFTINDVMALLFQMKNENIKKEEESKKKEEESKKKEDEYQKEKTEYKKEIEKLREVVTSLTLDIKSLQHATPNWGPLLESESAISSLSNRNKSYAEAAAEGASLQRSSTSSQSPKGSRVSFDLRKSSSDSSPRRSPPQTSMDTSIRSAMKSTTSEHAKRQTTMAIDLKDLERELGGQENDVQEIRIRIERAIRSIEGLGEIRLQDFRVRHTNQEVHFARFRIPKETESHIRQTAANWIHTHLRGAKLIGPRWYAIKVDWIDKALASDARTGQISDQTRETFGKENGVEVMQMKWLGRPKDRAIYASGVVKLATKEQAEKLLLARAQDEDVTIRGLSVEVSPFEDRRGPVACFKCQEYGHMKRECRNATKCAICAKEGHEKCSSTDIKCANCDGPHPAFDRRCPKYRTQRERMINLQSYA